MIIGLFIGELIALGIINIPFIEYFSESQVKSYKNDMAYFSGTHQNPENLFVEPTIDSNYRAIDSINFSSPLFNTSKFVNPVNNPNLTESKQQFFLDYLFEKQNPDGSYSNIGGLGDMYSTYKVIKTIDILNGSYLDALEHQDRINRTIDFINNSLDEGGMGFKYNEEAPEADIISTYYAIKLAKILKASSILETNNVSITAYIKLLGNYSIGFSGSYRYSNRSYTIVTAETTYYGVRAYLEMGYTYNLTEQAAILGYYSLLYNPFDGGFRSSTQNAISDVSATYYSLWNIYHFTSFFINQTQTKDFVINCTNDDGGFGPHWSINISDFTSGWSGMNSIFLLESYGGLTIDDTYKLNYYNWLYEYQAFNGLIGETNLQTNYLGVLALYNWNSEEYITYIDINSILDFVNSCYNPEDGGFGSQPFTNSSIFSTYCAVFLYQLFKPYTLQNLPNGTATVNYLVNLQNPDGGFKLGEDFDLLLSYFGPAYELLLKDLIDTNISTTESTYWAIKSLNDLNALNLIDQNNLSHWISSGQNPDGGFSIIHGFHSDVISTYYGLEIHKLLNLEPLSRIAAIEFLKGAQKEDGSFNIIPFLSQLTELPSSFISTYLGSIALYRYRSQPEDIKTLTQWYRRCISLNTGGVGDIPSFGGDLRNTPYGLVIIDEIRYDQAFDPLPWSNLLIWLMISEALLIVAFVVISILSYLNERVMKILKSMIGLEGELNINYLKRFSAVYCENLDIYIGKKLIVDGVSLELEHGEILGVLGESGAGKSTFVKALLGMRKYTGICEIYGMDVKKNKRKIRPIYGYVPQDLGKIYTNFTTLQNLIYFGKQYGLTEKEIVSKSKRLLRSLEIEDKMNELVKNLSGGQKRRVSIAMGLIHNPIFCILDEPTSGLDPVVRENLWLALTQINEKYNTTLIVISHYPEESRFCNKVVVFGRGRGMIDFGTPRQLLSQLPGDGRTIELFFYDIQEDAVERLEKIEGIHKALENKVGTDFALLTNLNLNEVREELEKEFGENSILGLKQSDSVMEQYFRFRAMEVPEIE
ncbi:MAG: ATP-binding cassette domain-containing protein [Candidatus Lokiarchaeota archaeon]|nr:ATP-binding cassette domain-containing protein [Candidatus Lokiarchaeota archaeon]